MLKFLPIVYYIYAATLVGGGVMGSVVSKKPSSLLGSLAFGIVAVVAGALLTRNPRAGLIIGLLDAVAVGIFFAYRYSVTQKPMPAFPSIALSVIVLVLTLLAWNGSARNASQ
ncbi:MAG: TMEM14 family protein [Capsulimonadales bacterium]|nr:TMEM14 family protein [Capsulimonadales bacterium]